LPPAVTEPDQGIYMAAVRAVGRSGAQEVYAGHAEDRYRVLSIDAPVATTFVRSHNALLTREWSPLEPGVIDHKLYIRGGRDSRGADGEGRHRARGSPCASSLGSLRGVARSVQPWGASRNARRFRQVAMSSWELPLGR
jgi:hypothetical protein